MNKKATMKSWMPWFLGIALGALGGYLYWYHIGCLGGSCPITSSPFNSTAYGGLMGGLLVNAFKSSKKE